MSKKCKVTGKHKLSELEAQLIVARVGVKESRNRKMREIRLPRRYYSCEFCQSFHTTSQEQLTETSSSR